TEDTAGAAAFYSKVVGWHAQPAAADPSYTQFGIGSGHYAGMMRLPDEARASGAKPQWMPYIGVADVEATAASIERLGGRVKKPGTEIPTVGRFAILSDPQGATFAIFKPAQGSMGGGSNEMPLGGFAWLELATTDNEAAAVFYGKVFGWQAMQRMDMGAQGTYLIFGSDGAQRGGIYKLHSDRSPVPYWLPYASVPSADAAGAAASAAGGRIVVGPMDVPGGGRIVQITDPSGAMFALHSAAAAKPAAPSKPAAKPAAAKPPAAKPAAAKPAPAKPPAAPSKAASPSPAAKPPAAKTAAPKKAAAKKAAKKKAAPKKAAARKKPAAKKKSAKRKAAKKASRRKSAARSARKPARKSARRSGAGKRKPGKARRKK
ncbi:MAG: VOC family protein, partial [Steroidobacterales bacterium]